MAALSFSVGRLIEQNSIVIGDKRGWMIGGTTKLRVPAGMAVTITDHPNCIKTTRIATARDDLVTGWPRVLFLTKEGSGDWGLYTVEVPKGASSLQRELSASLEEISFGEE